MFDRHGCVPGRLGGCLDGIRQLIRIQEPDVMCGIADAPDNEWILILVVDNRTSSAPFNARVDHGGICDSRISK